MALTFIAASLFCDELLDEALMLLPLLLREEMECLGLLPLGVVAMGVIMPSSSDPTEAL